MRKLVFVALLALVGAGLSVPAGANGIQPGLERVGVWNGLAMKAVILTRASDADAARMYAMLNVAVYDAVNGLSESILLPARRHALVPGPGPREADPQAAATAAAHAVLVGMDSARAADYDRQFDSDLAQLRPGWRRDAGVSWGRSVGQRVLAARADDGSRPVQRQPGDTEPGRFPDEWPGVQYRDVRPFALADPAAHVLGPPPVLTSLDYAAAFAEVRLLGDKAIPALDKSETFTFWSVPAGTVQPPGEWLRIALTVASTQGVGLYDGARMLALLTMAMSDTSIATVGTKAKHRHWRPATAIRHAGDDENPLTDPVSGWEPRAGSFGATPEWVSGHSSYSATAASVLAGFFCADRIPFTTATDSAPRGEPRTYPGFSAAAAEAGRSRVFGGQHFEFSNQAGLALGRGVAAEVLRTSLLVRFGPTHRGECPR